MKEYCLWSDVPAHLKTKTQLKEMKLKPVGEVIALKRGNRGTKYNLYDISQVVAIKQRKVKALNDKEKLTRTINNLIDGKDQGKTFLRFKETPILDAALIFDHLAFYNRNLKQKYYEMQNYDYVELFKDRQSHFTKLKVKLMDIYLKYNDVQPTHFVIQNSIKINHVEKERTPEQIEHHIDNLYESYWRYRPKMNIDDFIETNTNYTYVAKEKVNIKNILFGYQVGKYTLYKLIGEMGQVNTTNISFKGECDELLCEEDLLNKKNIRKSIDMASHLLDLNWEEITKY